jgi:glycosyltransferase involved in cell wall biosynthesis
MHIVLFHFYSSKPNPVYREISAELRCFEHKVWLGSRNENGDLEWHDGERVFLVHPGPRKVPKLLRRIPVLSPLLRQLQFIRFLVRIRHFLDQVKPDVVQVNLGCEGWAFPLFAPKNVHFLYDIRQINETLNKNLRSHLKELPEIYGKQVNAQMFYKHTFFCHECAARRILGENWQRRASVIPVGINDLFLNTVDLKSTDCRQKIDLVRFIYIGTLSRLRNLEKLIKAAKLLREKNIRFQLDIVGPDLTNGFYHRLVEKWGLDDMLTIKPPVDYMSVPNMLLRYHVGIAYVPDRPTWHYQPTIKVLEYRALGLPIISTNVDSHKSIVKNNVNGLLVSDSVDSIASGMQKFVIDRDFLIASQKKAQQMRNGLTWTKVAEMYEDKYISMQKHQF